jgi:transcriptional regulator with XRE-family HTH domain
MMPEQCRAARGWLNWTQADLATRAATSLSTVKDFEGGRRVPIANNLAAIRVALETGGIAFFDDDKSSGLTVEKCARKEST